MKLNKAKFPLSLLAIPVIFISSIYLFKTIDSGGELTGEVYDGPRIEVLKSSDAIWLTKWKGSDKGVLIDGQESIIEIIESISFANSSPGACGYEWNLYFMKNNRLIEKAFLVKHCHKNFRTDFGCFAYNFKFRNAMKPYVNSLNKADEVKLVYDFFFPASVTIEEAFNEVRQTGFSPNLFINEPDRYPNVTIEYTVTNSMGSNSQKAEELTERQAEDRLKDFIEAVSSVDLYYKNSEISTPGSSFGAGEVSFTKRVEIYFKPGTPEVTIRNLIPEDLEIYELIKSDIYSVQVLSGIEMSKVEQKDVLSRSKLIHDIKRR